MPYTYFFFFLGTAGCFADPVKVKAKAKTLVKAPPPQALEPLAPWPVYPPQPAMPYPPALRAPGAGNAGYPAQGGYPAGPGYYTN